MFKYINNRQVTSELTEIENYINQHKKHFLDVTNNDDNTIESKWNENIEKDFYDKDAYKTMIETIMHPIELKWRTNIMMDYTPFGNVMMFYDTFKVGFTYYCDRSLSYPVLNALAMKYVRIYKCHDFFMDEKSLPDKYVMPIHKIIKDYEKDKEAEDKKNKAHKTDEFRAHYKKNDDKIPFLKNKKIEKIKQEKEKELMTNKFIYAGKCTNCTFIQKQKKIKTLVNKMSENNSSSNTVNDYKLWKKMAQADN